MVRWFRSKRAPGHGHGAPRGAPGRVPGGSGVDWRSYDSVAEEYERVYAPMTARIAADLLELAEPGGRLLDVGTGTGRALGVIDGFSLAVGVDAATRMLAVGHRARPTSPLAAADVLDLPFRDDTFEVVMCNLSAPYFTRLDTALHDVVRVARPGGRVAVSVWAAGEDDLTRTWRTMVEETIGREVLRAGVKDEAPWAEKLSDPKRLDGVLRDAGLRPVTVVKRAYRFSMSRDDYLAEHEIEAIGRYAREMLGPRLWASFHERVRARFESEFPEKLVDFREVLLAVGTKPAR